MTLTALTNHISALTRRVNNHKSRCRDGREELNRVPRVESNYTTIFANLSLEEKVDHVDRHNKYDCRVSNIPLVYRNMRVKEFLNWQVDVDRFFDVMGVPKNIQVKMASMRLKSVPFVWWDKLVTVRQRERKGPVRTWRRHKQLMMEQFLPKDFEQISYKKHVECV
ncbi:hypothetical protein QQ045_024264 [Rhodiola kirilowii]